jgi:nucleotide sugar dehydrogenase
MLKRSNGVGAWDSEVIDLTVTRKRKQLDPTTTYDVVMVGLGYVGLPTALSFAAAGLSVAGVDLSLARLDAVRSGDVDLLDTDRVRLREALDADSLHLTSSPSVLSRARVVMVCVPTPVDQHLVPDLGPISAACATVVEHAQPGQVLILTSTTYVGTTRDLLVEPLYRQGLRVGEDVFVAFSPERIDPGNAQFAQEEVPRVVGGATRECTQRAVKALGAYARNLHCVSSPEAAELTKLYENTFRAVNIALANELADISGELGVDVTEVIDAAATKPYGFMAFAPGPGVGGHCIPCDPHYLLWQLKRERHSAPLIEQAMSAIAKRPREVVDRAREILADADRGVRGSRVLMVGVAYKPGVADLRESPALEVIDRLLALGACVEYFDPLVNELRLGDGAAMRSSVDAPMRSYDLVVINTLHPAVDYDWVAGHACVLDTTYRFNDAPHRSRL